MIIGSVSENKDLEKRISITPDIAKKYISLGFEIQLSESYGNRLGFEDKEYSELGVKFHADDQKVIQSSDIHPAVKEKHYINLNELETKINREQKYDKDRSHKDMVGQSLNPRTYL